MYEEIKIKKNNFQVVLRRDWRKGTSHESINLNIKLFAFPFWFSSSYAFRFHFQFCGAPHQWLAGEDDDDKKKRKGEN